MRLTTHTGRALDVEEQVDLDLAAVFYTIAKVGTLTFTRSGGIWPDSPRANYLEIVYGRWDGGYRTQGMPEQPVIFGVTIAGAAVFDVERIYEIADGVSTWWLPARRPDVGYCGQGSVPDKTRDRMAEIIGAVGRYHLERPDLPALDHAYLVRQAPSRLQSAQASINGLRERIAKDQADLARWLDLADTQLDLIPETVEEDIPA